MILSVSVLFFILGAVTMAVILKVLPIVLNGGNPNIRMRGYIAERQEKVRQERIAAEKAKADAAQKDLVASYEQRSKTRQLDLVNWDREFKGLKPQSELTVHDIFESFTPIQKNAAYFMIGEALEQRDSEIRYMHTRYNSKKNDNILVWGRPSKKSINNIFSA